MSRQEEIREGQAELEHDQWVTWASALLPMLEEIVVGHKAFCTCSICPRVRRWQVLTTLTYDELTEEQKDQDRIWADISLAKLHSQGVVIQKEEPYNYGKGDWYYPTEPLIKEKNEN